MDIPRNLEECFIGLENEWSQELIGIFRNESEGDLPQYHHGLGQAIRNRWIHPRGSHLSKFFEDLGIFHPDDMSAIILTSFHRYLNDKDIRLDEQRIYFARYWLNMGEKGGDISDWDRKAFYFSRRGINNFEKGAIRNPF